MTLHYYIDMDGCIVQWQSHLEEVDILAPGHFETAPEEPNILELVRLLINRGESVYILSSLIDRKPTIAEEKRIWLQTHLPELSEDRYIFVPEKYHKRLYKSIKHPGEEQDHHLLLDDYGINLYDWVKEKQHHAVEVYGRNKVTPATGKEFVTLYWDQTPEDLLKTLDGVKEQIENGYY